MPATAPTWQAFEKDPDGLKAAGTSTYGAGSPSIGLTNSSLDARNASAIDPTSDWLTNSADVHTDPMTRVNSGGATTTGAEGETCTSEEQTKTTTSHSLYTCETAIELHTELNSCTEHYEPKVESYAYVCDETYNYATHSWQRSAGCDAARGDGNCTGGTRTALHQPPRTPRPTSAPRAIRSASPRGPAPTTARKAIRKAGPRPPAAAPATIRTSNTGP